MIHRPHLDRLLVPSAGKSAGIPLGPLGIAAESQHIRLRLASHRRRRAGGEKLQLPSIKINRLPARAAAFNALLAGEENKEVRTAADHPEDDIGGPIEKETSILFGNSLHHYLYRADGAQDVDPGLR